MNYTHHSDWINMIRIAPTDEGYCLERTDWRTGERERVYYSSIGEIARVVDPIEKNGRTLSKILNSDDPPIAC